MIWQKRSCGLSKAGLFFFLKIMFTFHSILRSYDTRCFWSRSKKTSTVRSNNNASKLVSTATVVVLQVRLAIAEKGLHCEEYDVSLPLSEHNEPWFMHLNPTGEVPVLVHNDNVICDPTQIMDYLEQNFNDGETLVKTAWRLPSLSALMLAPFNWVSYLFSYMFLFQDFFVFICCTFCFVLFTISQNFLS